jgi:hypothetical protein
VDGRQPTYLTKLTREKNTWPPSFPLSHLKAKDHYIPINGCLFSLFYFLNLNLINLINFTQVVN